MACNVLNVGGGTDFVLEGLLIDFVCRLFLLLSFFLRNLCISLFAKTCLKEFLACCWVSPSSKETHCEIRYFYQTTNHGDLMGNNYSRSWNYMSRYKLLRRCLHDTRSSFIPVRLHPGSILSIYICLHDTNQNCIPERVVPERLHPGSRIGSKFSFQNEICLYVPSVSCKGGTGSFRYGNNQVDWLGWPADSCFRSVDAFTAFSFQNENVLVNVKQTMRVVLEWNSFRDHVNTT